MRDLWSTTPPFTDELTDREIYKFLGIADSCDHLTDWEQDFCSSLAEHIRCGRKLSPKQRAVLDKGLLRKLWDADPTLWDGPSSSIPRPVPKPIPKTWDKPVEELDDEDAFDMFKRR